jgi:ABC-type transporter Mla subunit MlaD
MLYPQQMHLKTGASAQSASDDWRAATDAALTRLIHLGYRARLQQSPPVLGDQSIQLVHMVGAPAAQLITDGSNPRFPSAPGSSDLDDIASKADVFLNKLDAVPLEDIGANLRKITGNLDKLMSSPELKDSLTHLHSTLTSIDKLLGDVQPQIGPLVGKLHDAAAELSGTATALRQLVESGGPNADASLPDAIRQITEAAAQIARQTLSDDLDQRLPSGSVIYPRLPKPDSALSISVDILEFTVVASQASMRASWLIVPAAGSQSAKRSVASLQGPMTSAEPAAVAHAWSELIGQLADRIAADVASFKIP